MHFFYLISIYYKILFMKKFLWILIMILICASCGQNNDKKARLEQLKKQQAEIMAEIIKLEKELYPEGNAGSAPVMIDTLKKGPFEHYIEVQGKIDGNENIGVSPRQPGVVTKILVKEGDHVTRGQLLAELDAEVLQRTYEELNTQLVYVTDLY